MSTGTLSVPRVDTQEDWWSSHEFELVADTSSADPDSTQATSQADVSTRAAVAVLGSALDLAVERGITNWSERRIIDALISSRMLRQSSRTGRDITERLLISWEKETGHLGSLAAARGADAYQELMSRDSVEVIGVALDKLNQTASPHILMLLEDLAGAAPASLETSVSGAAQAWISWGKRQGFVG
jgi:hypothetical protein